MPDIEFTQPQLDVMSERATKFLSTASQIPSIRSALERGGYSEAEHNLGWQLLLDLLGYKSSPGTESDAKQQRAREATAQLDQWDGPSFERARAALERAFPAQAAYVFDRLAAKTGAESIAAVRTFLDRYAALRDGSDPERGASRADDNAAAALLSARRIVDADEEKRLRALIKDATSLADLPALNTPDPSVRQQTAKKLDAWLRDWRESARVLVTRRDYQIRLGLAERRASKGEVEEVTEQAPSGAD